MRAGPLAVALLLAPALAGCVTAPPSLAPVPLAQAEAPVFDPFTFFLGTSEGTGTLAKVMADDVPVRVKSSGRIEAEARREAAWAAPPQRVLVLDQVVTEGDKPPRKRQWRLTEVAPGRYTGTLSDAISPVDARSLGNRLVITFTIKGGFAVRQELTLAPDGQSAANVMQVSKLGLTVAVLSEGIRKTP
jgi:hypothetical protein